MKKAKVDTGMPTVMEADASVQHLQDLLANARRSYPFEADLATLEDLKKIFEANADDRLFQEIFPKGELRCALDKRGMSYGELRTRLIPNCARKIHDMLNRQLRLSDMETAEPKRFAMYRELCQAAKEAMTPSF